MADIFDQIHAESQAPIRLGVTGTGSDEKLTTPAAVNHNPGNLRDPKTGAFRTYGSPEEGFQALIGDIEDKQAGRTPNSKLTGDSTLLDFAKAYAPKKDNNKPVLYAQNLAKHLDVTPDTPIGKIDSRALAAGVSKLEDAPNWKAIGDRVTAAPSQEQKQIETPAASKPTEPRKPDIFDQIHTEQNTPGPKSAVERFLTPLDPRPMFRALLKPSDDPKEDPRATFGKNVIGLIHDLGMAQVDQGKAAIKSWNEGDHTSAIAHGLSAITPILGPMSQQAAEKFNEGDVAGGLGTVTAMVAPELIHGAPGAARATGRAATRGARAVADAVTAPGMAKIVGGAGEVVAGGAGLASMNPVVMAGGAGVGVHGAVRIAEGLAERRAAMAGGPSATPAARYAMERLDRMQQGARTQAPPYPSDAIPPAGAELPPEVANPPFIPPGAPLAGNRAAEIAQRGIRNQAPGPVAEPEPVRVDPGSQPGSGETVAPAGPAIPELWDKLAANYGKRSYSELGDGSGTPTAKQVQVQNWASRMEGSAQPTPAPTPGRFSAADFQRPQAAPPAASATQPPVAPLLAGPESIPLQGPANQPASPVGPGQPISPAPQLPGPQGSPELPTPVQVGAMPAQAVGELPAGTVAMKPPAGEQPNSITGELPAPRKLITGQGVKQFAKDNGIPEAKAEAMLRADGYGVVERQQLNKMVHAAGAERGLDHAALSEKANNTYGSGMGKITDDNLLEMYHDLASKQAMREPLAGKGAATQNPSSNEVANSVAPEGGTPAPGANLSPKARAAAEAFKAAIEEPESPAKSASAGPPSVGNTGRDIYQAWKALAEGPQPPRATITGYVPGEGRFDFRNGKIVRVTTSKGRVGNVSTVEPATNAEIDAIHDAISKGQFQIEQRTRTGALGVRKFEDAGALEKTIHQATGRPLPEFLATEEGQAWAKRTHYRESSAPTDEALTDAEINKLPAKEAEAAKIRQKREAKPANQKFDVVRLDRFNQPAETLRKGVTEKEGLQVGKDAKRMYGHKTKLVPSE